MLKTTTKIRLAHFMYKVLKIFKRSNNVIAARRGIRYSLDLSEGNDLSVYLAGGFQEHLFNQKIIMKKGDAILDVGAN
jgi:hypothetical protein